MYKISKKSDCAMGTLSLVIEIGMQMLFSVTSNVFIGDEFHFAVIVCGTVI